MLITGRALGLKSIEQDARRLMVLHMKGESDTTVIPVHHHNLLGLGDDDHPHYTMHAAAETITSLWTFDRDANAPFAVDAASLKVTYLDADMTDGLHASDNPGASAKLVATDASGSPRLLRLGIGVVGGTDDHIEIVDTGTIGAATKCVLAFEQGTPNYINVSLGKFGVGLGGTPTKRFEVEDSAGACMRLLWDSSNYADFDVSSGGNLTIAPKGDLVFNPTGNDILPTTGYDLNIGTLSKKFLTLHVAELWVETLVAQNTIATIGGRILVGPTTILTSDVGSGDITIYVVHNQMAVNDTVYLEADSKVEFMLVTGGPTGVGPFAYVVTRNRDGSGPNDWFAGDAVFNTGAAGDGFIDIYSVQGVDIGGIGPAIVGNVRNSQTYNDWTEHWAIGNLKGIYGYGGVDLCGVGLGKYAAGDAHITIDSTSGIRFFHGTSTVVGQWTIGGDIIVGQVAANQSNVLITSGALKLRNNVTDKIILNADGTAAFEGVINIGTSGGIFQGSGTFASPTTALKIYNSSGTGLLEMWGAGTKQVYMSTDGKLYAGAGDIQLDSAGMSITIYDTTSNKIFWKRAGTSRAHIFAWYAPGTSMGVLGMDLSAMGSGGIFGIKAGSTYIYSDTGGNRLQCLSDSLRIWGLRPVYINESANSKMTIGLTINQGTNDNEILALKSDDVTHLMVALAEEDTFGTFVKQHVTSGGTRFNGYSAAEIGLCLRGYHTTDDTGKTIAANASVQIQAYKRSGTGSTTPGANANILAVRSGSTTVMITDAEGDVYYYGSLVPYDKLDDLALLRAFGGLHRGVESTAQRELMRQRIVTQVTGDKAMVCLTRFTKLIAGAVTQLEKKFEQRVAKLESAVLALGG